MAVLFSIVKDCNPFPIGALLCIRPIIYIHSYSCSTNKSFVLMHNYMTETKVKYYNINSDSADICICM